MNAPSAEGTPDTPTLAPLPGATAFVWTVWALMSLLALVFVIRFGRNVPRWDEWTMIPQMSGAEPVTRKWLWEQHNEHRIPVPKLMYLTLSKLTHGDFRSGMFLNVFALSGLSLGMILLVRKLRGTLFYADAFFPMLMLHFGQWENMLCSFQVQFVSAMFLLGMFMLVMLREPDLTGWPRILAAGTCLILLPLCGANGLALVPALALATTYHAWRRWRSDATHGRRDAVLIAGYIAATMCLVGLYLKGYRSPAHHLPMPQANPLMAVEGALKFLTTPIGIPALETWPTVGVAAATVYLAGIGLLGFTWWKRPDERSRVVTLLMSLTAVVMLAGAVGWGRARCESEIVMFSSRYVTLAIPAVCVMYLTVRLYLSGASGAGVSMAYFALACGIYAANLVPGAQAGQDLRNQTLHFQHDLRNGFSLEELTARHGPVLFPFNKNEFVHQCLQQLQQSRIGPFRSAKIRTHAG